MIQNGLKDNYVLLNHTYQKNLSQLYLVTRFLEKMLFYNMLFSTIKNNTIALVCGGVFVYSARLAGVFDFERPHPSPHPGLARFLHI
jgi:hypothetical protein